MTDLPDDVRRPGPFLRMINRWRIGPLGAAVAAALLVGVAGGAAGLRAHQSGSRDGLAGTGPPAWPQARMNAVLVADAATSSVILFGGQAAGGGLLGDTWSWSGSAWTALHPVHSPSPRARSAAVYDVATGRIVLVGGMEASGAPTPAAMQCLPVPQPAPAPTVAGAPPREPVTGAAIVPVCRPPVVQEWVHDTWAWDGSDWTAQPPPAAPAATAGDISMAYDESRNEIVLVGLSEAPSPGRANAGAVQCRGVAIPGSSGARQSEADMPPPSPPAPPAPSLCGVPMPLPVTWTGDGSHWTRHDGGPGGGPFLGTRIAYDPATKAVRNFPWSGCGMVAGGAPGVQPPKGSAMPYPCPMTAQSESGGPAMDVHPAAIIAPGPGPAVASIWDGSTWRTDAGTYGPPTPDGLIVQDRTRSLVSIGGAIGVLRFDGHMWKPLETNVNPGRAGGEAAAWDASHGATLLFGGDAGGRMSSELWNWDGALWTRLGGTTPPAPSLPPAPSIGPGLPAIPRPPGPR